jgi:hypothetical protein
LGFSRRGLPVQRNKIGSYDKLVAYADKAEDEVKEAYAKSSLPNQPDYKFLDNLCIQLTEMGMNR